MSRNEGLLSKYHFGGEVAHTGDHPPVFRWGVPADSCPAMGAGMLLTAADGNTVFAKEVTIPARPYIGLNQEIEDEAREIMQEFIKDSLSL